MLCGGENVEAGGIWIEGWWFSGRNVVHEVRGSVRSLFERFFGQKVGYPSRVWILLSLFFNLQSNLVGLVSFFHFG